MADWRALSAVEALIRRYQAEQRGREIRLRSLDGVAQEVYQLVETMCEWRLGRETLADEDGVPFEMSPEPVPLEEIIACLKRIRKSINFLSQSRGRDGYLTFVEQHMP
ncbi:MAG: hypothetical protein PVH62_10595 [Anaerolineae bacterium]|jgi:hypothetical protein